MKSEKILGPKPKTEIFIKQNQAGQNQAGGQGAEGRQVPPERSRVAVAGRPAGPQGAAAGEPFTEAKRGAAPAEAHGLPGPKAFRPTGPPSQGGGRKLRPHLHPAPLFPSGPWR